MSDEDENYLEDLSENENAGDELYEHYHLIADIQDSVRIDKFLMDRIPNVSRTRLQALAHADNLIVNGKPVKPNYKVRPKDDISIVLPFPVRELKLVPENIPLNILYEDDDLIIVNKPANMVVHPGYGNYTGTLLNGLLYHFENLPRKADDYYGRPGLVHRIDKHTTGILVVAKTEHALTDLAKQFFDRTSDRRYYALVWGDVVNDEGTITGHIGRSQKNRKSFSVYEDGSHGKPAVTHYKVVERFRYVTLVECKLETGRTHQIRVHFQYINHPLFHDLEYGGDKIIKGTTFTKYRQFIDNAFKLIPGQALHAKTLGFKHPRTGQWMQFDSELPPDFQRVLEKWRNYSQNTQD
jgi:23S rRNA pseudouridine1911/1915/1917 synthase